MPKWTHDDLTVAAAIAEARRAGRATTGHEVSARTGLSKEVVCAALRKLLAAEMIRAKIEVH